MPSATPKGLRVLETIVSDIKEIRGDVNEIKIIQARNKEVNELSARVHVLETKVWILYMVIGGLGMESIAVLGYLIKQWVEK